MNTIDADADADADADGTGASADRTGASADAVVGLVRRLLTGLLPEVDASAVTLDTEVASLGISSIQLLELVCDVEDALGVTLPDDELTTLRTVRDLAAVVGMAAEG